MGHTHTLTAFSYSPVDDDEAYFAVEPDNDNVEDPSDCLSRKLETFAATNSNPILIVWVRFKYKRSFLRPGVNINLSFQRIKIIWKTS